MKTPDTSDPMFRLAFSLFLANNQISLISRDVLQAKKFRHEFCRDKDPFILNNHWYFNLKQSVRLLSTGQLYHYENKSVFLVVLLAFKDALCCKFYQVVVIMFTQVTAFNKKSFMLCLGLKLRLLSLRLRIDPAAGTSLSETTVSFSY